MWSRYRQIYWSWRGISSCKQDRRTVSVLALQPQRQEYRGEGKGRAPDWAALTPAAAQSEGQAELQAHSQRAGLG